MTPLADKILDLLKGHAAGRANARKADALARTAGCTWRQVMHAVEELRNAGIFVASARSGSPRGLYLPATDAERTEALGSFRRAALTMITTYNRLKRARRLALADAGQRTFF